MALYAFDGTWNEDDNLKELALTDTNVSRFLDCCDLPASEEAYKKGVGTRFSLFGKALGGLAGTGGKKRIREMFKQLAENYRQGDEEIHLIGFSRGAALALHFANEIHDQGLVNQAGEHIEHPQIGFMGLWDTVGSFGIPFNAILPFQKWNVGYDLTVAPNVTKCYHALSIHERRETFTVTRLNKNHRDPRIEERWFRGVHSDVGGGNENVRLSNISLKWMLQKAADFNLPINAKKLAALTYRTDHINIVNATNYTGMNPTAPVSKNLNLLPDPARKPQAKDLYHETARPVTLSIGETREFIVGAGEKYSWSGVRLEAGASYTFNYSDEQTWKDDSLTCGPSGWTLSGQKDELNFIQEYLVRHAEDDRRHPEANWFEVVGTLGKSEKHLFRIGDGSKKSTPYVPPRTAELFCFANDLNSKYGNNKGEVCITVERTA